MPKFNIASTIETTNAINNVKHTTAINKAIGIKNKLKHHNHDIFKIPTNFKIHSKAVIMIAIPPKLIFTFIF